MLGKRAAALTLVVLTAACVQEDRPVTVSLEEAREIALELVESEFEAPPPGPSPISVFPGIWTPTI